MRSSLTIATLVLGGPLALVAAAQTTWYVDGSCGDDAWTGQSALCQAPDGPKRTLGAGLDVAADGDTVMVAPGVYTGEGNTGLTMNERAITLRSAAGPEQTIVDGAGLDRPWLAIGYAPPGGVIDGFTVRRFESGFGALRTKSLVTVVNCRFVDNNGFVGGGIHIDEDALAGLARIVNCEFIRNTAAGGGGIFHKSYDTEIEVVNCTFVDCEASEGSAFNSTSLSASTVHNCVARGPGSQINAHNHCTVSFSNIEGEFDADDGGGNIDAGPVFAEPGADDYRLLPGSPCIDAADNTRVPDGLTTDFGGLPRFADDPATEDTGVGPPPVVDMGAHEFPGPGCYADFTGDGALDLFDYLAFVNAFNADDPAADCDHSGVLDLFDFLCFANGFNEGC